MFLWQLPRTCKQLKQLLSALHAEKRGMFGNNAQRDRKLVKSQTNPVFAAKKAFIGAAIATLRSTRMATYPKSRETWTGVRGPVPLNPTGPNLANPQYKLRFGKGHPRLRWPGCGHQFYNSLKRRSCSSTTHCCFWSSTISNSCFIIGSLFYHSNWTVYFTRNYWCRL